MSLIDRFIETTFVVVDSRGEPIRELVIQSQLPVHDFEFIGYTDVTTDDTPEGVFELMELPIEEDQT